MIRHIGDGLREAMKLFERRRDTMVFVSTDLSDWFTVDRDPDDEDEPPARRTEPAERSTTKGAA